LASVRAIKSTTVIRVQDRVRPTIIYVVVVDPLLGKDREIISYTTAVAK
jgi:hypothetical protein